MLASRSPQHLKAKHKTNTDKYLIGHSFKENYKFLLQLEVDRFVSLNIKGITDTQISN